MEGRGREKKTRFHHEIQITVQYCPWEVCKIWCLLLPTEKVVSLFSLVLDKAFVAITLKTVFWCPNEQISKMSRVSKCPQKMCSLSQNPVNPAYRLSWEGQVAVHLNLSWGSTSSSGLSLWDRNMRREKAAVHLLLLQARHTSMQCRLYLSQPIILLFLK